MDFRRPNLIANLRDRSRSWVRLPSDWYKAVMRNGDERSQCVENVLKTQQVKIIDVTMEFEVDWGLDKVRNEARPDGRWFWIFDLGLR